MVVALVSRAVAASTVLVLAIPLCATSEAMAGLVQGQTHPEAAEERVVQTVPGASEVILMVVYSTAPLELVVVQTAEHSHQREQSMVMVL